MNLIVEITKNTYDITFSSEVDYEWHKIAELFITSDDLYNDLDKNSLITKNESKDNVLYWQDMFFMEAVENRNKLPVNNKLVDKLKSHPLFQANLKFISQLPTVTKGLGRELLIDAMIANKNADKLITDEMLGDVIKKKSREELRKKFDEWGEETKKKRSSSIRLNWIKYSAIAAVLVLGFLVWQPTQSTNEELFAYYSSNLESITEDNFNTFDTEISNSSMRGKDFILKNYTSAETEKALNGLDYFKAGNFDRAKQIFTELSPKERNNQILFFLALSQLNTNEVDASISNFEYLLKEPEFSLSDDVKFHLAMAYLKKDFRKKSKKLLIELATIDGKIGEEATLILEEMRWF
jgi:hypothetical protein